MTQKNKLLKYCKKCGSVAEFYDKQSYCINCQRDIIKKYRERKRSRAKDSSIKRKNAITNNTSRICSRCRVEKPLTEDFFYKSSSYALGFTPRCKDCEKYIQKEKYHRIY